MRRLRLLSCGFLLLAACSAPAPDGIIRVDVASALSGISPSSTGVCASGTAEVWSIARGGVARLFAEHLAFDGCSSGWTKWPCRDLGEVDDTRVLLDVHANGARQLVVLKADCRAGAETNVLPPPRMTAAAATQAGNGRLEMSLDLSGVTLPLSYLAQTKCALDVGFTQFVASDAALHRVALLDGSLSFADGTTAPLGAAGFQVAGTLAVSAARLPARDGVEPLLFLGYRARFSQPGTKLALSLRDVIIGGPSLDAAIAAGAGTAHVGPLAYVEASAVFDGVSDTCSEATPSRVGVLAKLHLDLAGSNVTARTTRVAGPGLVEAIAFNGLLISGEGPVTPSFVVARGSFKPDSLLDLQQCPGTGTLAIFGRDAGGDGYRAVVPLFDGASFSFEVQRLDLSSPLFASCFP